MSSNNSNKALVDAIAGVCASLIALWTFYPIDVWITNVQADVKKGGNRQQQPEQHIEEELNDTGNNGNKNEATFVTCRKNTTTTDTTTALLFHNNRMPKSLRDMFAGWKMKTIHTTCSSFCYFYIYSFIFTFYLNNKSNKNNTNKSNGDNNNINTSIRLLLTAIAAMINTLITLPLDVISAQQQQQTQTDSSRNVSVSDKKTMKVSFHIPRQRKKKTNDSKVLNPILRPRQNDAVDHHQQSQEKHLTTEESNIVNEAIQENNHFDSHVNNDNNDKDDDLSLQSFSSSSSSSDVIERHPSQTSLSSNYYNTFFSLWKGLIPSLVLSCNPSIHYTTYETLKNRWLTIRQQQKQQSTTNGNLNMTEAFVIGLIAKFVATIITYPIVKAKVILMVTKEHNNNRTNNIDSGRSSNKKNNVNTTKSYRSTRRSSNGTKIHNKKHLYSRIHNKKHLYSRSSSLTQILSEEYNNGGIINGLYRGCSLQLFHTLLKTALLMMLRERITNFTHKALLLDSSRDNENNKLRLTSNNNQKSE